MKLHHYNEMLRWRCSFPTCEVQNMQIRRPISWWICMRFCFSRAPLPNFIASFHIAVSEQFQSNFRAISEQFQSNFRAFLVFPNFDSRAFSEQFQSSCRAVSEQFQSSFRAVLVFLNCGFSGDFRAVLGQFQSNCRTFGFDWIRLDFGCWNVNTSDK